MRLEDLDPTVRKAVSAAPRLPFDKRWGLPLARFVYNLAARSPLGEGVDVSTGDLDGLRIRLYKPLDASPTRAILWFFGGGHIAGKAEHLNRVASQFAIALNAVIVVPEYRLAPKHPFPADLEDAYAAWSWLVAEANPLQVNQDKIVIAGHSAGGGLAAALVNKVVDAGGLQPAAQLLFYPMLDDRTAVDRSLDEENHFIWNNQANLAAWRAYLNPAAPGSAQVSEYAAPARRQDLTGLPPTWIGQCGLDLFFQEYVDYANRLTEAGVDCSVYRVSSVPHAFEAFVPNGTLAKEFEQSAVNYAEQVFSQ